jgi:hypothetical protein
MSTAIAATLVNWSDFWEIMVAALVGGTGVAIVFGLLLLGVSRGKTATRATTRYGLYTFSGLCGVLVIAAMAVGVYAMTQKPSSAKPRPRPKAAAAGVAPAGVTQGRGASTT